LARKRNANLSRERLSECGRKGAEALGRSGATTMGSKFTTGHTLLRIQALSTNMKLAEREGNKNGGEHT
jgi:hypothetical protein